MTTLESRVEGVKAALSAGSAGTSCTLTALQNLLNRTPTAEAPSHSTKSIKPTKSTKSKSIIITNSTSINVNNTTAAAKTNATHATSTARPVRMRTTAGPKPHPVRAQASGVEAVKGAKSSRVAVRGAKKEVTFHIPTDETHSLAPPPNAASSLPPKAQYALATDVANITLKLLSDASKDAPNPNADVPSSRQKHPTPDATARIAARTPSAHSQRALQSRSDNASSANQTAWKPSDLQKAPAACRLAPTASDWEATAECASLAFDHLASVDVKLLGVRPWPPLQLETGMLALAARLIRLGFAGLATRELRVVKQRLENLQQQPALPKLTNGIVTLNVGEPGTLASLLQLDIDFDAHPTARPLAITYQTHVLQLIATSSKPAAIEESLEHLMLDQKHSPAIIIMEQANTSAGDRAKAAKQLEVLSQTIWRLCPSTTSAVDEAAKDPGQSVSPLTAFKLRCLALEIRQKISLLTQPQNGSEQDVAESLSKCMSTLLRRMPTNKQEKEIFEACKQACETLVCISTTAAMSDSVSFSIYRIVSVLAERAALYDEARAYAKRVNDSCQQLERNHARSVTAQIRMLSVEVSKQDAQKSPDTLASGLDDVQKILQRSLVGSASDYETLLSELQHLVSVFKLESQSQQFEPSQRRILGAAAAFASRFVRMCPGKQTMTAQEMIMAALSHSKTNEDLLSWIHMDTAHALIQSGVLREVVDRAGARPLSEAWKCTNQALALGRTLGALVLKAAASDVEKCLAAYFDDEDLMQDERGTVLEWQLKCAFGLAHKPEYSNTMARILPTILHRLYKIYVDAEFPVRRARVTNVAMRIRVEFPDILDSLAVQCWTGAEEIEESNLGRDAGLGGYMADIKASIALSQALEHGRPILDDLRPSLLTWQRLLESASEHRPLENVVDNPAVLALQLASLDDYFGMLGDNASRLIVARLLARLQEIYDGHGSRDFAGVVRTARAYLALGYAEQAGEVLAQMHSSIGGANEVIGALEYHLCRTEHLLVTDQLAECKAALKQAADLRAKIHPQSLRPLRSKTSRLLHGRAWLLQSRYLLAVGSPHVALRAAKRAVKVIDSIWSGLERSESSADMIHPEIQETDVTSVHTLVKSMRKLDLTQDPRKSPTSRASSKGAAFWAVVPVMCQALVHLSDTFVHHGVFIEAKFASEKAVNIAEAVGARELLSQMRYHYSVLLARAGKIEEAELCFAHEQEEDFRLSPLTKVAQLRAKAVLSIKLADLNDAGRFLAKAEAIVKQVQSKSYISTLERLSAGNQALCSPVGDDSRSSALVKQSANPNTASKLSRVAGSRATKTPTTVIGSHQTMAWGSCYILQKLEAQILLQKAIISLRLGQGDTTCLGWLTELSRLFPDTFDRRELEHLISLHQATEVLQADFSFNALPESVLAFPALQGPERRLSAAISLLSTAQNPFAKGTKTSRGKKGGTAVESLEQLLLAARRCLVASKASYPVLTTAETHKLYAMLANASMIQSATSVAHAHDLLHPVREALSIDLPRIHAAQCQLVVSNLGTGMPQTADPLLWPPMEECTYFEPLIMGDFQEWYINILPKPWTVVSLGLNDACDELYVTRYRRGQSPLILRLPLSCRKSEDAEEELFDFHSAKEELEEIIALSNYSCHSPMDTNVKGAKTNWWNEREALDKRLQELLINIENIWLGEFRGVLSQYETNQDLLGRFRKSFEAVLDRHLPSRQASRRGRKKLMLDDRVLELFVGLGHDQDGERDLDEVLADLLNFVVEVLQFNGERNAYDEVDFDSMAVEVLDALRTYYDAGEEESGDDSHLILVLDRRLQAFPWENLPCLEKASVSRVDSLHTLRQCIVQMDGYSQDEHRCHYEVSKGSGSYILNPSQDLKSTEALLSPELARLASAEGTPWNSVVGREPSEEVFKAALQTSSTLLYFGHGAGSQYIRPRQIRRLENCSEVVWLMGCSSGAVAEYDELEPFAVPLAYLQAGQHGDVENSHDTSTRGNKCLSVLATLWDVTDKDIDRFSLAVGQEWGLWEVAAGSIKLPAKTPRKRTLVAPCTPEKTAKTPKIHKTPAPARTPARSQSRMRNDVIQKQSLAKAVSKSRDACYLRYLNGAAAVVYGVPVYLGD